MDKAKPGLGIVALVVSLAGFAAAIVAAVLSAADSGTSFGRQFVEAERAWLLAGVLIVAALSLGVGSAVSRRGRRLGGIAIAVAILAAPVAVVLMDALPAAQP